MKVGTTNELFTLENKICAVLMQVENSLKENLKSEILPPTGREEPAKETSHSGSPDNEL